MYSIAYKFGQVFSVAYFDAGSYEDAIHLIARMKQCEGAGDIVRDDYKKINVMDRVLWLYNLQFDALVLQVYAADEPEAVARALAVQMSNRPIIRTNTDYM